MKKRSDSSPQNKTKAAPIAAVAILVLAVAVFGILSRDTQPTPPAEPRAAETAPTGTAPQARTMRNANGEEFTHHDIVTKFNAFMRDAGADTLCIEELLAQPGEREDTYHDAKNSEEIGIFMTTRSGGPAVTSVTVLARSGEGAPTAFITYCSALMDIFTPTMNAVVRQRVLYRMMGYEEGADAPLADENTYIIVETKYIFTYSEEKGLSMRIEQMPELEEVSDAELPPLVK